MNVFNVFDPFSVWFVTGLHFRIGFIGICCVVCNEVQ